MMPSHKGVDPRTVGRNGVLILVVMDDALALLHRARMGADNLRLNPCCNG